MPELSYREAVRDALAAAMRADDDVFLLGEDIAEMGGSMGVTQGMLAEFGPERVRNTPISEMALAGAQHAQQLEAWFVHIPGLKVLFPSTPTDVRGLLWSAIYDDNPVVFFEHRTLYPLKEDVPEELEPIPLGKARVHREGEDVTVIATGRLVHEALKAAEDAEGDGVSVEVVDPRTLQPVDEETLVASVKKTNRCVVAHEAVTRMGFGAEVAAVLQ